MRNLEERIVSTVHRAIKDLFNVEADAKLIQIQKTRKEFKGDFTLVVFPLLKYSSRPPESTAADIGEFLVTGLDEIKSYNVIKGFLNLEVSTSYWISFLSSVVSEENYANVPTDYSGKQVMVEYSSPNTNKPLHLGHIRNNLIGYAISRILEATGSKVVKVNLVNDRGIHICKSMLAYQRWGRDVSPESTGIKGDRLVGDYYVMFETEYRKEQEDLVKKGMSREEAEKKSEMMSAIRDMLVRWEAGDPDIIALWKKMNSWVYEGFDETYKKLGVEFDRIYHESETYKLGKSLVSEGLNTGVLYRKEDGSVWIDLTGEGLDHKLLLRSDGTSVYITQDLGTAHQRFSGYDISKLIYVVGNEQNYHFQVLKLILKKMGYEWFDRIYHLSYGMVELPEGRMKSREGTVVDADDLISEMTYTAKNMSDELGKLGDYPQEEKERIYSFVGLGALKYFILKVDPKKNMMFDPKESIDFNGNTGPFIQYTYTRIQSILRKAESQIINPNPSEDLNEKEISLLKLVYDYPEVIKAAASQLNPALIANFLFELAKEFNQFYHDYSILSADNENVVRTRLMLSDICSRIIKNGMFLLGIDVPERM